MTAKISREGDN